VAIPSANPLDRPHHGYGLNIREHRGVRVLQHGGSRLGFGSVVRLMPQHQVGIIILTNRTNGVLLRTLEKATELTVPLATPAQNSTARSPLPVNASEMAPWVGTYENAPDYLRIELLASEGRLWLRQVGSQQRTEVSSLGATGFSAGGQEFLLLRGTDGRPKYLYIAGHALRKTR
jgi:hypothetical protein